MAFAVAFVRGDLGLRRRCIAQTLRRRAAGASGRSFALAGLTFSKRIAAGLRWGSGFLYRC